MSIRGVWLPVITPFNGGNIDWASYESLVNHYITNGIDGIIPLGTTGESPVVTFEESLEIMRKTVEIAKGRCPVFAGVGGNDTRRVVEKVKRVESIGIDGILSVCPYYNRPGQDGIFSHFETLSRETDLKVIMYNIPYRTGVNMLNATIRRLAKIENIVGIKDSCGDIRQSLELLANKPEKFSVLTGEDFLFFTTLANGGDGGILASSHFKTRYFLDIFNKVMIENDIKSARSVWRKVEKMIPLLFKEPNPGPIKYCLERKGRIASNEMRLPMTGISDNLKTELDARICNTENHLV